MKLFQFTDNGLKSFENAYDYARRCLVDNEKTVIPIDIDDHLSEENIKIIDRSIELPIGPFSTRFVFAEELFKALGSDIIENEMYNVNLWSGLACFYFDQICMNRQGNYVGGMKKVNSLGENARVILNTGGFRIYRHLVWGPLRLYYYTTGSSKKILSKPLTKGGDVYEAIASRRNLLNVAGLEMCNKIGWHPKRRDFIKNFQSSDKNLPWTVRSVALTLNQLEVNHSISDCESPESQDALLNVFPEDQISAIKKIWSANEKN